MTRVYCDPKYCRIPARVSGPVPEFIDHGGAR